MMAAEIFNVVIMPLIFLLVALCVIVWTDGF